MQATKPLVEVPGDNKDNWIFWRETDLEAAKEIVIRPNLMARSGTCLGMSNISAVWRFGTMPESEAGRAYGIYIHADGFLWILSDRDSGEIIERYIGYAIDLPAVFRHVLEWEAD